MKELRIRIFQWPTFLWYVWVGVASSWDHTIPYNNYVSDKMSDGYDGFMCPQASSKASDAVAAETKSDEDADN